MLADYNKNLCDTKSAKMSFSEVYTSQDNKKTPETRGFRGFEVLLISLSEKLLSL